MKTLETKSETVACREIVVAQNELYKKTHKELFSFRDECYYAFSNTVIDSVLAAATHNINRLHLSVDWENMLRIAVWTSKKPLLHDVVYLLKRAGIVEEELGPFRESDINDLFPWLYYSNRSDVLRRICNAAKSRAESKIGKNKVLVSCHLVSDEIGKVVASSL